MSWINWKWRGSRLVGIGLTGVLLAASAAAQNATPRRNVIVFVADGLRTGSVNATVAPTMLRIRTQGVFFANSHSLFPTFTTPNASAIATGHYLGDTGDFSNTVYAGFPLYNDALFGKTPGTLTPFLENNQVLADMDAHFQGNYLNEESLMAIARRSGYRTASVGKVGPVAIQDVTQTNAVAQAFGVPTTTIIDDATGTSAGLPIPGDVSATMTTAGMSLVATPRNQPAGTNVTPGTTDANLGQQQYFADAMTKGVLPTFQKSGQPFYVLFWSRDPDGTQHNQGDSLNKLSPGINGPTSLAAIHNADNNLKQILDWVAANPTIAANTDIFLTADHGFATISKYEVDAAGTPTQSFAAKFTYKDATGRQEVNTGFLPAGFLAIDLANALKLPLYDPDTILTDANGNSTYSPVDWTIAQQTATVRQRPASGNGILGGSGKILTTTDASVVVAANGGSDLIYIPSKSSALTQQIVTFLSAQDYVAGLFVDPAVGPINGALPMTSINLQGATNVPMPTIAVNFKTFSLDPKNPLLTAVQIADSTLQEGQGMHGTLSRDNTYNNMAAIGPDFKAGYVDSAPVANTDVAPTLAQIMGLPISAKGKLVGRVLTEALAGNADTAAPVTSLSMVSPAAANGKKTVLLYQQLGSNVYFDQTTLSANATIATISKSTTTTASRELLLDGTASLSSDGGPLTYSWSVGPGNQSVALLRANTPNPVVQFSGAGTYTFVLTVTDAAGVTSTDTYTIQYVGR